jgi:hypothetical protein
MLGGGSVVKIKTELPTEPGAYWWRLKHEDEWSVVLVKGFGPGHMSAYQTEFDAKWSGRSIEAWAGNYPIGFWCRIPTPSETQNDKP